MFGQGYVLGVIVTTVGLYSWSKWKMLADKEKNNDNNGAN